MWNFIVPRISKISEIDSLALPEIKNYYKANKTIKYWPRYRQIDHWTKIKVPESIKCI